MALPVPPAHWKLPVPDAGSAKLVTPLVAPIRTRYRPRAKLKRFPDCLSLSRRMKGCDESAAFHENAAGAAAAALASETTPGMAAPTEREGRGRRVANRGRQRGPL